MKACREVTNLAMLSPTPGLVANARGLPEHT